MSALEINKFFISIIIAIFVFIVIGIVGNLLVNPNKDQNQETAYKIDIPEPKQGTDEIASKSNISVEPITSLLANASIDNGEKIYKKCGTCHNYTKDSKSKVGPNLWDIVNRLKANVNNYSYSSALANYGGKWTYEELNAFLYKPKNFIEGTKMNFSGLQKAEDRADLILWLRKNSDDPASLP